MCVYACGLPLPPSLPASLPSNLPFQTPPPHACILFPLCDPCNPPRRVLNDSFRSLSSPAHAASCRAMALLALQVPRGEVDVNVTPDKRKVGVGGGLCVCGEWAGTCVC